MAFIQTMTVRADSAEGLTELLEEWHREQAGVAPGYRGARALADQDRAGRYVIEVDFSSREEAEENNARPETQEWAQKMQALVEGEPEYRHYQAVYTAG